MTILRHWILLCGIPEGIHSDQGSQFESDLFKDLCESMDIVKTHTTSYHPQGNGMAERMNRTIVKMLSNVCVNDQSEWEESSVQGFVLLQHECARNNQVHTLPTHDGQRGQHAFGSPISQSAAIESEATSQVD